MWAARNRRPLYLSESAVRLLTGKPAYTDADPVSPWAALLALNFPKPLPTKIETDPRRRRDSYAALLWETFYVDRWLAQFDQVSDILPTHKRKT